MPYTCARELSKDGVVCWSKGGVILSYSREGDSVWYDKVDIKVVMFCEGFYMYRMVMVIVLLCYIIIR